MVTRGGTVGGAVSSEGEGVNAKMETPWQVGADQGRSKEWVLDPEGHPTKETVFWDETIRS